MATLRALIRQSKELKKGGYRINIAIGHKADTCYISTPFIVESKTQFKDGRVIRHADAAQMNIELRNMLNRMQEKLNSIKHINLFECQQIKVLLTDDANKTNVSTVSGVTEVYVQELLAEDRTKYAYLIQRNVGYFTDFIQGDMPLDDINPHILALYSQHLKKRGVSETSIGVYLSKLKVIVNYAIKEGFVKYDVHPFIKCKIRSSPVREADISVESFNKIRFSNPERRKLIVARDLFCLSFYLGGMNLIDIMNVDFRCLDHVEYIRSKSVNTRNGDRRVRIKITEHAQAIINKWMNPSSGKLDFGYKFAYIPFANYMSNSIVELAKELGIHERVIFYSARKSFAQYASDIGIPDNLIDYCLGHSDRQRGVIRYYTKVRQNQADIAVSRVADYVDNPDKYKAYIEMKQDIMMMRM